MSSVNDLAILLTKKIESDIVSAFYESKENLKLSPSYYNIRETILATLREYIKYFFIEESMSPEMIRNMTDEMVRDYQQHMKEKQAFMAAKEALNQNVAYVSEWEDEWSRYKRVTTILAFIDLNKLKDAK